MARSGLGAAVATCLAMLASVGVAKAQLYAAVLSGFNEVGLLNNESGAIFSPGSGQLTLHLDTRTDSATYTLTFSGLTSLATMAHIHFGQVHVPGGIMVWLCQTKVEPSPVMGTPFCPRGGGSVSGTITAGDIVAVSGQNVTAGDFNALVEALASGSAYSNIHSVNFPLGELRGQIVPAKLPQ
jgi:CHRD domain